MLRLIRLSSLAAFVNPFVKGLLFVCWGVTHSIGDSQDIRFMGGISNYISCVMVS